MTNAATVATATTTDATDTTVAATTTVATTTAPAAPAAPKVPSKKSQANAIFAAKLTERSQGLFASNKEFRAAVLGQIQTDLGVTLASAATMYNAAKKDAETADATVALGRDPKVEKVAKGTGQRGRPKGSKNKEKDDEVAATTATAQPLVDVSADPATEVANVTEPVVGELTIEPVVDAAPAADAETVAA